MLVFIQSQTHTSHPAIQSGFVALYRYSICKNLLEKSTASNQTTFSAILQPYSVNDRGSITAVSQMLKSFTFGPIPFPTQLLICKQAYRGAVRLGEKRGDFLKNIRLYLLLMLRVHSPLLRHSVNQTCNTTVTIPRLGLPRNLRFNLQATNVIYIWSTHS